MSCHNIGRAMDSVVVKIMEMYDEKKFSADTARELILAAKAGVGYCDGNYYEAVESIRLCRCGRCLKKIREEETIYSLWDLTSEINDPYPIMEQKYSGEDPLVSDGLCEECFRKVITEYTGDTEAAEREIKWQQKE